MEDESFQFEDIFYREFIACCRCSEPYDFEGNIPEYLHRCGCPSVDIDTTATTKQASMCGRIDFSDETIPYTYYKNSYRFQESVTFTRNGPDCVEETESVYMADFDGEWYPAREGIRNSPGYGQVSNCTLLSGNGSFTLVQSDFHTYSYEGETNSFDHTLTCTDRACDADSATSGRSYNLNPTSVNFNFNTSAGRGIWNISASYTETIDRSCFPPPFDDPPFVRTIDVSQNVSVGVGAETWQPRGDAFIKFDPDSIDTEEEAIAAAEESPASSIDGSVYELRTTSPLFRITEVEYTATAKNLNPGMSYKGVILYRRQEAYSGDAPDDADFTDYLFVGDEIEEFTATGDTQIVAENVKLPLVKGYRYRIANALIWPTNVDCPNWPEEPPLPQ